MKFVEGLIDEWEITPIQHCFQDMFHRYDGLSSSPASQIYDEIKDQLDGFYCITGCNLPAHKLEHLIVPNLINGCIIIGIANDVFRKTGAFNSQYEDFDVIENQHIRTADISEGIMYIGDSAFEKCTRLQRVSFPPSLFRIGGHAFADCSSLSHIRFNDDLTVIGRAAFLQCVSLQSITLPDQLRVIETYAFMGCKNLVDVRMPSELICVRTAAFSDTGIQSINLPDKTERIGAAAFSGNSSIRFVHIPRSVRYIDDDIFDNDVTPTFFVYPGSYGLMWAREHGYRVQSADV